MYTEDMENDFRCFLKTVNELKPVPTGTPEHSTDLSMIKAVIFDIYGTLFISGSGDVGTAVSSGSSLAFGKAFEKLGIIIQETEILEQIKDQYFLLITQSHSRDKKKGILYPEVIITDIWAEILNNPLISSSTAGYDITPETAAAAFEGVVNPVWPMPGLTDCLKSLYTQGYKLGIVSNAQFYTPELFPVFLGKSIKELGFNDNLSIFSYRTGRGKPDVYLFEMLKKGLSTYSIDASEAVFVGNDMLNDIYAAHSAGLKTALFAGDKRSLRMRTDNPSCRKLKPDVIFNNLGKFPEILREGGI